MYETDYNNFKAMTLFNFFPKFKKFKYGLFSVQKENQSSNKKINDIGRRTTTKKFKSILSHKNFFSSEKLRIMQSSSRFTKNNKDNYLTIQSDIQFYRTSTNFCKTNKGQINTNICREKEIDTLNNEQKNKMDVKKEFSIEKQQSNKNFFVDRLFSKYKNKMKNSANEVNVTKTENAIKKNNYLTDEKNVKMCGIYKGKNKKNNRKSSIKFKTKYNNNVKYYNNQLPLLNKVNTNKNQLLVKGVQNTEINSEKNSKKIFVFKNNFFLENNSNKENNNNENNNKNNDKFIIDNQKKYKKNNNIYSSYNLQKENNKFYFNCNNDNNNTNDKKNNNNNYEKKNKKIKITNSNFGNNNIIFINSYSNSKYKFLNKTNANSFYNSQNNKIKATCSSDNIEVAIHINRIDDKINEGKKMEIKRKDKKVKKEENSSKNANIFANFTNSDFFISHRKRASVNGLPEVKYSLNPQKGFLKYENNLITNDNNLFISTRTSKSNFKINSMMSNNKKIN